MTVGALSVRSLTSADFEQWRPLWDDNNMGQCRADVTEETWRRLLDNNEHVYGFGAFSGDTMAGLLHYILHPVTGHINPVCYMQDVYVDPPHRQNGIAKALVGTLAEKGMKEKWARIYWLADNDNAAAQKLYENIGVKLNFSLHILPL